MVNELRLGNFVYDYKGAIGKICFGNGGFDVATKENGFSRAHEGSPIPLTPEILEKCGARISSGGVDISNFPLRIYVKYDGYYVAFNYDEFDG